MWNIIGEMGKFIRGARIFLYGITEISSQSKRRMRNKQRNLSLSNTSLYPVRLRDLSLRGEYPP